MNWIMIGIGAVITFLICLGLNTIDVDRIEANNTATLQAQIKSDTDKCKQDQQITSAASTRYENQITFLNSELERLRNTAPAVVYVTKPSIRPNATAPKQSGQSVANAIDSGTFIDYSGDCESDRLKVIGLQDFINKVWEANDPTQKGLY